MLSSIPFYIQAMGKEVCKRCAGTDLRPCFLLHIGHIPHSVFTMPLLTEQVSIGNILVEKAAAEFLFIRIVIINVLHTAPDLLIKIHIGSLPDHAFHILTQVCIKQIGHFVASILRILINLVRIHFLKP